MSGAAPAGVFLDDRPDSRGPIVAPEAPADPVGLGDIFGAHKTLAQQDFVDAAHTAEANAYQPIVDALDERDDRGFFGRLLRPSPYQDDRSPWQGARASIPDPIKTWSRIAEERRRDPDFLEDVPATSAAEFSEWVKAQELKRRRSAQDVVSRERGFVQGAAGFASDVAVGLTDPINLGVMAATGGAGAATTLWRGMAREALINGATEAAELPIVAKNRERFGEELTPGEAGLSIVAASAGGAAFHAAGEGVKATARAVSRLVSSQHELAGATDGEVARAFAEAVPAEHRTPDQAAALHVIGRDAEIDATNPFVRTPAADDAHNAKLQQALAELLATGTGKPQLRGGTAIASGIVPTFVPRETSGGVPRPDLSPDRIVRFVLRDLEGGAQVVHYSDADGGTTKYGIAAAHNPGVDVANLSEDEAAAIAKRRYWFPELDKADPRTAAVAFDAGYISGPKVGRRILAESGGDPAQALALYRAHLNHIAETVPGKAKYRKGWNARVDKLETRVGLHPDDRVTLDPARLPDDVDDVAASQSALDQADLDALMLAEEQAAGEREPVTAQPVASEEPAAIEGTAFVDDGPEPASIVGPMEQVVTARGREVDTQFEVREAQDLIDSSRAEFDAALQPRDRGRSASDVQIARIAGSLDPRQLAESRLASTGAPIVGPDGMVETGNGRVNAIRRAYAKHPERAAEYRAMIEARHPEAAGLREPVLVRRRTTPMTDLERRAWVADANETEVMAMSPAEQAAADARALTPATMQAYRGGELTDAQNRPFVRAFLSEVASPSEVNRLVDGDGQLSVEGQRRINQAILARAYDAPDLVARLAEASDDNIRSIGTVLTRIAPSIAQLRDMIADGRVDAAFDLSEPLADVARRVSAARDAGTPVGDILRQTDIFGDEVDAETAALLRLFFRGQELTRPRSMDKITDALDGYVVAARLGPDFLGHQPTPEELIYAKRAEVASDDEGSFTPSGRARARAPGDGVDQRPGGADGAADDREPTGAEHDEREELGLDGPPPVDGGRLRDFDDPDGAGAQAQAKSLAHDLKATFPDWLARSDHDAAAAGHEWVGFTPEQREAFLARQDGRSVDHIPAAKSYWVMSPHGLRSTQTADGARREALRSSLHLGDFDEQFAAIGALEPEQGGDFGQVHVFYGTPDEFRAHIAQRGKQPTGSRDADAAVDPDDQDGWERLVAGLTEGERSRLLTDLHGDEPRYMAAYNAIHAVAEREWTEGASARKAASEVASTAKAEAIRTQLEQGRSLTMRNPRTVLTITSLDQFRMVDGHPMVTERGKWVRLAPHEFDSIAHQAGWRPDLFDATDQFRLDVEGGERSLGDILGDVEADEAAIKAARDCL